MNIFYELLQNTLLSELLHITQQTSRQRRHQCFIGCLHHRSIQIISFIFVQRLLRKTTAMGLCPGRKLLTVPLRFLLQTILGVQIAHSHLCHGFCTIQLVDNLLIESASPAFIRTPGLVQLVDAGSARLFSFSPEFGPFSVSETNSSVLVPPDTTLVSQPVNSKDKSIKIWSNKNLRLNS